MADVTTDPKSRCIVVYVYTVAVGGRRAGCRTREHRGASVIALRASIPLMTSVCEIPNPYTDRHEAAAARAATHKSPDRLPPTIFCFYIGYDFLSLCCIMSSSVEFNR